MDGECAKLGPLDLRLAGAAAGEAPRAEFPPPQLVREPLLSLVQVAAERAVGDSLPNRRLLQVVRWPRVGLLHGTEVKLSRRAGAR